MRGMRSICGFNLEREPFDFFHADARAFGKVDAVGSSGAPKLAVDEDHTCCAIADGFGDFGLLANQFFFPGGLFPMTRAQHESHKNDDDVFNESAATESG